MIFWLLSYYVIREQLAFPEIIELMIQSIRHTTVDASAGVDPSSTKGTLPTDEHPEFQNIRY